MCVGVHEDWLFYLLFQISLKKYAWSIASLAAAWTTDSYLVLKYLER